LIRFPRWLLSKEVRVTHHSVHFWKSTPTDQWLQIILGEVAMFEDEVENVIECPFRLHTNGREIG
jgi:hypothetical protein